MADANINIILIPAEPTNPVELRTVDGSSLRAMKELVDGDIATHPTGDDSWTVLINEESDSRVLPRNERATIICDRVIGLHPGDFFVGNVLLVGTQGMEMVSVPEGLWEKVISA